MSTPSVAASASSAPSSASAAPSTSSAPSAAPAVKSAPPTPHVADSGSAPAPTAAPGSGGGDPGAPKSEGNAAQAGQAAAEAAAKEAARKLKLKVNGREMELEEPEVIRRAQLASAADEKFREASEMRKQAEQFFNALLDDPKSVLMHPEIRDRINFRALAEEYLGAELQKEMMSPEQRELEELRAFKKKQDETAESAKREQLTKAQQEEMTRLQQRAAQEYDKKITEVLAQSSLPKTPYTVKRVAELLHGALTKGYDLDVQTAVDMVREGYMTDVQSLVGGLDGDHLVNALGPDILKRLRKYDLERIKAQLDKSAPAAPQPIAAPSQSSQRNDAGSNFLRPDEWKEAIRKKAGF
jgi:hypothetical protein